MLSQGSFIPAEAKLLNFFYIISWLESKIKNRPMGEILREKSGYLFEKEVGDDYNLPYSIKLKTSFLP